MKRRQEIVQTAGSLFRQRGYHATTMRDIAKQLELRGSSLYAHVDSKEALLWEIVSQAASAFLLQAESIDPSLETPARLEALIRGHMGVIAANLPNATVFFQDWHFLSSGRKSQVTEQRDVYEGYFRRTVEEGRAAGVFHVKDSKLATLYLLSALNWSYQWLNPAGPLDLTTLSDHYVALSFAALGAPHLVNTDAATLGGL